MSQTLNASTLLAVPMAPLVGAILAGVLGTQFGGNWIGRRMSHSLTILGVLLSFVLSAIGGSPNKSRISSRYSRFNEVTPAQKSFFMLKVGSSGSFIS